MRLPLRIEIGPGRHYDVYGADDVLQLSNEGYYPSAPGEIEEAKLIVRAVNAHDALVEALQLMLTHEGERETSGIGTEHDSAALEAAKNAAWAALTLARATP